jgi:deoxyribodipyrimidine photo-lyase
LSTVIWWIRRDLRLSDNPTLGKCLENASSVIPLFIFDPAILNSSNVGPKRTAFLIEGLRSLAKDLSARSSRLIIRTGNPVEVLKKIVQDYQAESIYAQADHSSYARHRDQEVKAQLPLILVDGPSLSHPDSVLKSDGTAYTVFTPYMRSWKKTHYPPANSLLPAPNRIPTPEEISSDPIPQLPDHPDVLNRFPPGSAAAHTRLTQFAIGQDAPIFHYADDRNRVDLEGTSQLSPYLRFGMISAREAIVTAYEAIASAPDSQSRKGAETWLEELIWREFYIAVLFHYPHVLQESFRSKYRKIKWRNQQDEFEAWCQGKTGYPIVDAAMRQLAETGWMHNRARMITASFLVKDLLIDWRWGERWFMQNLVDGDPAANNGGWQWTAGTGTDAAPYFRIFNPVLQAEKFDPDGKYICKWVPELGNVPHKYIHAPWKMPKNIQNKTGCVIGESYPPPIVDHAYARERTLETFKAARAN